MTHTTPGLSPEQLRKRLFGEVAPEEQMECLHEIAHGAEISQGDVIEEILCKILKEDRDPVVRHEAAFVLGHLHSRGKLAGVRAVPALCEASYRDPSVLVRHEAVESLGWFDDDPRALQVFRDLLNDPHPDIVATARLGLRAASRDARLEDRG